VVETQLIDVWAAAVRVQEHLWLSMSEGEGEDGSSGISLGGEEEVLMTKTVLWQLAATCRQVYICIYLCLYMYSYVLVICICLYMCMYMYVFANTCILNCVIKHGHYL
jgi:hypothetical protein